MSQAFVSLTLSTLLALALASSTSAAIINVPADQPTIQDAVNAAAPAGDEIVVAPGTYVEQVIVNAKQLTIRGAGAGSTIVRSPAVLATTYGTNKPVITAMISPDVQIRDLTVDGFGQGNANNRIVGVGYWNAGGKVLDCSIIGVRNDPSDGAQAGVGIHTNNDDGGPYALEVARSSISDFQKNGTAMSGAGLSVDMHDCTVTGAGNVNFNAQNGIQISFGASGTVANCAISDLRYFGVDVASGVLVYQPGGDVNLSGLTGVNAINDVEQPVYYIDGNGSINGIEVTGVVVAGEDYGPIFVYNTTSSSPQTAPGVVAPGRPVASPVDVDGASFAGTPHRTLAAYSVSISNGCLDGVTDVAGTAGVFAYTEGGPLSVSVTDTHLSNWDIGLGTFGAATSLGAGNNLITSNATAGYDNTGSGAAQDAENNWWGSADGPSGAGPGSGDAVVGPNVDFTPWLLTGTGTNPDCPTPPTPSSTVTWGSIKSRYR